MTGAAYRFTRALAREPGATVAGGLRAVDVGAPDPVRMRRDHAGYVAALRAAGVDVTVLPALDAYPDALFVEDTALCLPDVAILLRPGAPSRAGEVAAIAPALRRCYRDVLAVRGPGHVEGGDILFTGAEILVGRSARTDAAGIAELTGLVAPRGYTVRQVQTPPAVLHLKSDCALLGPGAVLATARLAASGCFDGYRVLPTAPGEEAAANAVRVNHSVLFAAGYPATARRLRAAGYALREIDNGEGAKLDGGMSCLSLRF